MTMTMMAVRRRTVPLAARITNQTVHDSRTAPAEAQALYSLDSSGIAYIETSTTGASIPGEWLVAGNPATAEARATLIAGFVPNAGVGMDVWVPLTAWRTWGNFRSTVGTTDSLILIEIRNSITQAILASAYIELRATIT